MMISISYQLFLDSLTFAMDMISVFLWCFFWCFNYTNSFTLFIISPGVREIIQCFAVCLVNTTNSRHQCTEFGSTWSCPNTISDYRRLAYAKFL